MEYRSVAEAWMAVACVRPIELYACEKRLPHRQLPLLLLHLRCLVSTAQKLEHPIQMIHLKTVVSLLAVLIAVVPVTPVEKVPVPDDPESLPVDGPGAADVPAATAADVPSTAAGGQGAQPRWLRCAKRCQKRCLGMRNEKRCATNFVAQHCFPFGEKVGGVVVAKCQEAIECEHNGMKLCPDTLQCLLQDQCCVGCHSNYRCINHWCAAKGSPSFTLTWTGYGTYPSHEYFGRNGSPFLTCGV
jgi:hypothetical protein